MAHPNTSWSFLRLKQQLMAINKGETVTNLGRGGERGGETEKEMDGEPRLDKDI